MFPVRPPRPVTPPPPVGLRVAHRGGLAHAPENSLEAVATAADLGADAVELDVRPGPEGHLVCAHDAGQDGPRVEVALRLAEELGLRVELDVKGWGATRPLRTLSELIGDLDLHDQVWLSAFHPLTVWRLRMMDPRLVVGLSLTRHAAERAALWTGWLRWLRVQMVAPEVGLITPDRLSAWQGLGLHVEAWTVPHEHTGDWLSRGVSVVVDRLT